MSLYVDNKEQDMAKKGNILARLIEPKQDIEDGRKLFSNGDLRKLIVPLVIEQLLIMMVGMVDTVMISHAGEAAVSGVSLVDMINDFFIFVFSALATGGAVVVSQYIGSKDRENTNRAASQLVMITTLIAMILMIVSLSFHNSILHLMFGRVEKAVMTASTTYLVISAFSFPFLGLYNASAALFRSMSRARVTLNVSLGMNLFHVLGNAIAIFLLHAGVAGVAVSSMVCRALASFVLFGMLLSKNNLVRVNIKGILTWKKALLGKILKIAVPNGIQTGLFQLSKLVLISMISGFGTAQIAANGVANSIDYVGAIIVTGLSLSIVTVVGQCVGARDYEMAVYYIRKFIRIAYVFSGILDIAIIALMPLILKLYALTPETDRYVFILVVLHNLFIMTIYPYSGPISNAMNASGDVRYTMKVSIFATVICRVVFSIVLGLWLHMGIIGVWIAMGMDWSIRAMFFIRRFKSGKWKEFRII